MDFLTRPKTVASSKRILFSKSTCNNHVSTKQEIMNKLQFALENSPLMSIQSQGSLMYQVILEKRL